jgi:ribosomal protein S18 acetylase RimI-like enzyme
LDIIRAEPGQAGELTQIAMAAKAHWGYPEHWMKLWGPQLTITPEYIRANEVWAIRNPDELAGFYSLSGPGQTGFLENLWVLPGYMRQGAGRQMFIHALTRCRTLGYRSVRIEADPHAQGFYERMGARKIGEHASLLEGRPRILPVLELELE